MTATTAFIRYLKDNGLYVSYYPVIKQSYNNFKKQVIGCRGKEYWNLYLYNPLAEIDKNGIPKNRENVIMLDMMIRYCYYRFIDTWYVIQTYNPHPTPISQYLVSNLYRYSIKNFKRYQLTTMMPFDRAEGKRKFYFEFK